MSLPEQLPDAITQWMKSKDYTELLPVQELVHRHSLEQDQLLVSSPTGSGKTIAFMIPATKLLNEKPNSRVLIVSPSPELAMQNINIARTLLPEIKATAVIGGVSSKRQKEQLKSKPRIISATPGRLREFILNKILDPSKFDLLIFDEIDALLRDGIENMVADLLERMPAEEHQVIAVSATITKTAQELLCGWRPEFCVVRNEKKTEIRHSYVFANPDRRDITLQKLIQQEKISKAIIFVNHFEHTSHILNFFAKQKIACASLEAGMDKHIRKKELDKFRKGQVKYLITTDLLSRGMDISDSAVIHYHCPVTLESFRHRSGRTGRGSETGANYMMITAQDVFRLNKIEKKCDLKFTEVIIGNPKSRDRRSDDNSEAQETPTKECGRSTDSANSPKLKKSIRSKLGQEKLKADKKALLKQKRKHSKRKGKPGGHKKKPTT